MKFKIFALIAFVLVLISLWTSCSKLPEREEGGAQSESQTEAEEVDVTEYFAAAEFLTEKIVMSMPKENFESGEINKTVQNNLLIWLVPNAEEIDMRSPYNSIAYVDQDGYCRFSAEKCAEAMYEIFGKENFEPELSDARFDGERGEYIIDWGFGVSTPILASEIWAEASGAGGIAVNFTASKTENIAGDPVWVPFGEYQMQLELLTENGKNFLRYVGMSGFRYPGMIEGDLDAAAEYIAENITSCLTEEKIKDFTPNSKTADAFIVKVARSSAVERQGYDKRSIYGDTVSYDGENYHINKEKCEKMVEEIFGLSEYEMSFDMPDAVFDEEKGEYISSLSEGEFVGLWHEDGKAVSNSDNVIKVEITPLKRENEKGEGGWFYIGDPGKYIFTFNIMQNENGKYLRFVSVEEIPE